MEAVSVGVGVVPILERTILDREATAIRKREAKAAGAVVARARHADAHQREQDVANPGWKRWLKEVAGIGTDSETERSLELETTLGFIVKHQLESTAPFYVDDRAAADGKGIGEASHRDAYGP